MTQPTEPVTTVQVLAEVSRLCIAGLPVPSDIDLNDTALCDIWLGLRLRAAAEVDAWAGHLGLTAEYDPEPFKTGRKWWRRYSVDVYRERAATAWAPGVGRVHIWCSVDMPVAEVPGE